MTSDEARAAAGRYMLGIMNGGPWRADDEAGRGPAQRVMKRARHDLLILILVVRTDFTRPVTS